jgi:phosphotransferase system HPr-like phosphotransfer protein
VTIRTADKPPVPARSILSVLALGARFGTEVILEASGEGAEASLDALAELLARNLDAEESADAQKSADVQDTANAQESADA